MGGRKAAQAHSRLCSSCESSCSRVNGGDEEYEEDEKEENIEGDSPTEDPAPKQAPELWATMPAVPEFWVVGPSYKTAG